MNKSIIVAILLSAAALVVVACTGSGAVPGTTGPSIADTVVQQIESTRDAIQNQSVGWQQALRDLEASIADDASSIIRNDVNAITQRAISATSLEVKCTVDFLRDRVVEELNALLAKLTGQTIPPRRAWVCNTIPNVVAMDERPHAVEFFGYNFTPGSVTLRFHDGTGAATDLTNYLTYPSHYNMTVPVGSGSTIDSFICNKPGPRRIELTAQVGGTSAVVSSISLVDRNCPTSVTTPPGPAEQTSLVTGGVGPNLFKNENETLNYGGSCKPGYEYVDCTIQQVEGNGSCQIAQEIASSCTCKVNFKAPPTQSVRCEVRIFQRKKAVTQPAPPCQCK